MKREKVLNMRVFAVVAAFVLLVVSVVCYGSFDSSAGLSQRTYLRYDSTNPNATPYQYTISVPESVFSGGIETYTIYPPNDMVRDYDTSVVNLKTDLGTSTGLGSGFIISDHVIMTAAHCVYDNSNSKFLDTTAEIVSSDNKIVKKVKAHYIHIPQKFSEVKNVNDSSDYYAHVYDYALLYFDEDLSEYGTFDLGICLDKYIENEGTVIASGFPDSAKYPDEYLGSDYGLRFKAEGKIIGQSFNGGMLNYDADVAGGDSGGPVYVNESCISGSIRYDYNTVIAIITRNGNSGVRINYDILYFCYQNDKLTA